MTFIKGHISEKKGRKFEEIYGEEKAKQLREEHSKAIKELCESKKLIIPNQTGFKHSDETKKKIGSASKNNWNRTEYREQYSNSKIKLYRNNELYLNKLSIKAIKSWKDKEVRMKRLNLNPVLMKNTSIEIKIQKFLTQLRIEYLAHKYISEITHDYQCDIFVPVQSGINQKTVIECDGDYWHGNQNIPKFKILNKMQSNQKEKDNIRTQELTEKGYRVIRLWEKEIRGLRVNKFSDIIRGENFVGT